MIRLKILLSVDFIFIFQIFIVGSEPVSVGKPGKQKKKLPYIASGAMIDDWHTCVKNLNVSSRENQAHRLVDGNGGHWQSCGTQGKVCIMLNQYR